MHSSNQDTNNSVLKKRPLNGHYLLPVSKKQRLIGSGSNYKLKNNNIDINNNRDIYNNNSSANNKNKEKQKTLSIRNHNKLDLGANGTSSKTNNKMKQNEKSRAKQQTSKKATQNKKRATRSGDSQQPEYLERSKIFYSKSYYERINSNHPLNGVNSSNAGAYKVLNSIFSFAPSPVISVTCGKPVNKIQRLPKHLIGVKNLFKTVIENFKKLKLRTLLKFYCPCPKWLGGVRKGFGRKVNFWSKIHFRFLVKSFTPVEKVKYFIFTVISSQLGQKLYSSL